MKVRFSQVYIEVGVGYPFSHHFQRYLSEETTKRTIPSEAFMEKYAEDFDLIFNVSAKKGIDSPEVKGPLVYKKDKDIEFTVFLTFDGHESNGQNVYRRVLKQLIDQVVVVLEELQIDVSQLIQDSENIIENVVVNPRMIDDD